VNNAQELKILVISLLKMQGKKQKKMLEELGFSASFLTALGSKSGIPSINRVGKMASYLNVSTDYLLGVHAPGKAPKDVLREVYLAMPKKDQQAALQRMLDLSGESDPQKPGQNSSVGAASKKLQSLIDEFENELASYIGELDSGLTALGEKINALASAPDQREIVMAQFLAMPSHLRKKCLKEAVELSIGSQE
jgi:transcriptional regulator with XRE-family HTH domain